MDTCIFLSGLSPSSDVAPKEGMTAIFILTKLNELEQNGKLKVVGKPRHPLSKGRENDRFFVEAAIAGEADYLLTRNFSHFNIFQEEAKEYNFKIVPPSVYIIKEGSQG